MSAIPLLVCKVISIHKNWGVTIDIAIGPGEVFEKVVVVVYLPEDQRK